MKRSGVLAAALLTVVVAPVTAEEEAVQTRLSGYQETPLTINTAASGEFTAKIHSDGTAIDYELTYRDLSSPITQSHIHFGRPEISGLVVQGRAEFLSDGPDRRALVERFLTKYHPALEEYWSGRSMPPNRVMFRIVPSKTRAWGAEAT